MAAITYASPTTTLDLTDGAVYAIGCTGTFAGARLQLEFALAGSDTEFSPLDGGEFLAPFSRELRMTGTKLKATLVGPAATSAVHLTATAAA